MYEDKYQYLKTYEKERTEYNIFLESKVSPYYGTINLTSENIPKNLIKSGSAKRLLDSNYFRNIRNFESLKADVEFHGIIKDIETWSAILGTIHTKVRNDVMELIKQIEEELNTN